MFMQLLKRFSKFSMFLVLILGMAACDSGGGGSSTSSGNTTTTNTAPVASDASLSLLPGATVTGTLVAQDAEGDTLTYSIVTQPSDGTLTLDDSTTGAYTYVSNGTANSDSFTFKANDGKLDSNIATVTITSVAPDAPASGLTATAGDQSNKLSWDAVTGADSYNVYRSLNIGTATSSANKIATDIKPPFYDNSGLTNGTTYYYVVTSVNKVGESVASVEVNATPSDILISSLSFADAHLQNCVNSAASGISWTYVHDVTSLICGDYGITDISGIEALTSLTSLNLGGNTISNLDSLSGLSNLTNLSLSDNNIVDLGPLVGLSRLVNLNVTYNSIVDLGPLAGITSLTSLNLYGNNISDVSPLASLTGLAALDLRNNSIGGQGVGHVDQLKTLTNTTSISLGDNISMSCSELSNLISALGSPPVDTDGNVGTADSAQNSVNCTNP